MIASSFKTFIVIFYSFPIIITISKAAILECSVEDYDYSGRPYYRMTTCNPKYQKCCNKGCCTVPVDSTWVKWVTYLIGLLAAFCFFLWFYVCWKRCTQHQTSPDNNQYQGLSTATAPPNPVEMGVRNNPRPSEIGFTVLPQNDSTTGVPQGNHDSHVPITPPPAYNVAMLSSPLNPNNRTPSYEDVTSGKNT